MVQRYIFFNSAVGDPRTYQASDFADYFGSVLSTGLLHTDNVPGMSVSVETGTLNTVISAGKAIMKGHFYDNTAITTLTHSIPEPTLNRIDRIVLRLDLRNSERNILLHVKEGVASSTPVAPVLQRDNFIYEISLARVLVRANTVQLLQSDLVDERLDETLCGLVYSLISIPTDQLQTFILAKMAELDVEADGFEQQLTQNLLDYETEFNTWFDNLQGAGYATPESVTAVDDKADDIQAELTTHKTNVANPHAVTKTQVGLSNVDNVQQIPLSQKGVANGVASLGADGLVPTIQLPNTGKMIHGEFVGNGTTSRLIPIGLTPKNVILYGAHANGSIMSMWYFFGTRCFHLGGTSSAEKASGSAITTNGFTVDSGGAATANNVTSALYFYVAYY